MLLVDADIVLCVSFESNQLDELSCRKLYSGSDRSSLYFWMLALELSKVFSSDHRILEEASCGSDLLKVREFRCSDLCYGCSYSSKLCFFRIIDAYCFCALCYSFIIDISYIFFLIVFCKLKLDCSDEKVFF